MAPTASTFHLSLNVSNLARSVAFYRVLFGRAPAKDHADYAKFELTEPPVIFSLVPRPSAAGGSPSRVGLRLADAGAVAAARTRLESAGVATQTACGDTAPARFYVLDPDLNAWELSAGEDAGAPVELPAPAEPLILAPPNTGPVVWEHYLTAPLPDRIPHEDGTVDEVRLTGAFNAALGEEERRALLRDVGRVLRPGGQVVVHGLVGDRALAEQPRLPGLAALVQRVPAHAEPVEALRGAGFVGIQFVKFSEKAWFRVAGVEMREVKLVAFRPWCAPGPAREVVYRGPFAQAADDAGNVLPRGQRASVSAAAAAALHGGAAAGQFLFLPPAAEASGCGAKS
jgi:catechol 2,3-dioxygenase-like lactoylglutathione lyase family enzyme